MPEPWQEWGRACQIKVDAYLADALRNQMPNPHLIPYRNPPRSMTAVDTDQLRRLEHKVDELSYRLDQYELINKELSDLVLRLTGGPRWSPITSEGA